MSSGTIKRVNRKRVLERDDSFKNPETVLDPTAAVEAVNAAFNSLQPTTKAEAQDIFKASNEKFPDEHQTDEFWDTASHLAFKDFFVWGHDHDFGFGYKRKGSMTTRHFEITSESMSLGFLPKSLKNKKVLDIGCWSGGDLIVLAGLGGSCIAIEEHPVAAKATSFLNERLDMQAEIISSSVYNDNEKWRQNFDYIYCSGVVYHVTDPVLFLRILFCYLNIGGELLIETKAIPGNEALCGYSGVLERGWNWYAPDELTLGRWFVDAGFVSKDVTVSRRTNGRLLAHAIKRSPSKMIETAGFSRPGSWLEGKV